MPESTRHEKSVQAMMDEQRNLQIVQEQRLMQVEQRVTQQDTRITVIEVKQGQLETALTKLADIMTVQATKTTLNEAAIVALKDGQVEHNRHMEELKKEQVETGKLLVEFKSQMGLTKAVGNGGLAFLIGVLVSIMSVFISHFLHF